MADAKINETCIIGMPICGYAFGSSRMAFIATPNDQECKLELEIITQLLKYKDYEAFIALEKVDPGKFAFCTKICSRIITSQFCIVLLNSSKHNTHPEVQIPNPNVHLEYGLMMAFKKYIIPLQKDGDILAFNIQPLDTILYMPSNFKDKAERAIDQAILTKSSTERPTRAIASNDLLLRYIAVRQLRLTNTSTPEASEIYRLGSPMGFMLLDGLDIVYFGMFDLEPAKEVVFRLKLLLQNLHQAREFFEKETSKTMSQEQIENLKRVWSRMKAEVLISKDVDKEAVRSRVRELTQEFITIPWDILTQDDLQAAIDVEYGTIGEI